MSTKFKTDKESCKPLREKQFHISVKTLNKGSTKINKNLTMLFYEVKELEELYKQYSI